MARNSQKIIQLLRSSQIYVPTGEGAEAKTGLENAIASFNGAFVQAADPQDGEIMLARYQEEQNGPVKSVLAAYTDKNNEKGFTFYIDSVAINAMLDELSDQIDVIEVKNSIESSDESVIVTEGDETTPTNIIVNVDGTTIGKANDGALKSNLTIIKEDETTQGVVLDANVKEQYKLVYEGSTTAIGQVIKVYKDSSLVDVYLGADTDTINPSTGEITKNTVADPQSMNFKYQLANGTYQLVKIDVSKFLTENEFGAGLKVQNGVVSLDVRGTVTVGEDVTYVAININDPDDKLTAEEYAEAQQQSNYYTYVNKTDPTDMLTDAGYQGKSAAEQENYQAIAIQDTVGVSTNVFNENNGVVDVNAIQNAIDYASLSAAEGVRVSGSDAIRVDSGNTVYLRLSGETDNVLDVETGANKGLYLSGTWDCGEY